MKRIGNNLRELCLQELAGKSGAELTATKKFLHKIYGMSRYMLSRMSAGYRVRTRSVRRDAGVRKIEASEEEIQRLQALLLNYNHLTYARTVNVAEMNGIVRPGAITPAMFGKLMVERGISQRRRTTDVAPAPRYEARWPNDIWIFDTSKMEHLHLDVETMRVSYNPRLNYKNSRGERSVAIWLYLFVDDFSRVEFPYLMIGLNHFNHIEAMRRASTAKQNPIEFPAYGLPRHIRQDNGGGNQSLKWHAGLVKLDVHNLPSPPASASLFGSRTRGKGENPFRFYNRWEKDFKMRDSLSWAEAEEFLYQTSLQRNNRVHGSTGQVPFQRWLGIDKPLHAPDSETFKLLTFDNWPRKIDIYGQFELDGATYWAAPEERNKKPWVNLTKEWVQVYAERDRRDVLYVAHHTLKEPIKCVPVGDNVVRPAFRYEDREPTNVEEARERAKATGTFGNLRLWDSDTTAPAYLPRKGEPFDNSKIKLDPPAEAQPIAAEPAMPEFLRKAQSDIKRYVNRIEVKLMLRGECNLFPTDEPITAEQSAWVEDLMAGREVINEDEVRQAVEKIKAARSDNDGESN